MDRIFDFEVLGAFRILDFETDPPGWITGDEVASTVYLKNAIIDHFLRSRVVPKPAGGWLGLFVGNPIAGGVEMNGPGYLRASIATDDASWFATQGDNAPASTGIDGDTANAVPIAFADPTSDWPGVIDHWALFDQASGGQMFIVGQIEEPFAVHSGDPGPFFDVGSVVIKVL